MSQENVEVIKALFAAWNAGDMDAVRALYDPDVIVRTVEDWPEPGPYVGREAVMRFYGQLRETWAADTNEPVSDFIDVADHVVVRYVWRGTGQGPEANMELTLIFTVRKGKIVYQEFFWDHDETLETLGLSERAVSQENVDVMRRNFEAWQMDDLEAFMAGIHPNIEWHAVLERLVEGPQSVYRGHEGARRLWHTYRTDLDGFKAEAEEIRDVGGDRVLFLGRIRWRGVASGIETESPFAMVITFRDGKMFHSVDYLSREEALEALGLSEQDAHADS